MTKTPHELEISLPLDRKSVWPLYIQLRDGLIAAIVAARLKPGTQVPSTRHLAKQLGVSRIVTVAAYEDLLAQGYLVGRRGAGTFVAAFKDGLPSHQKAVKASSGTFFAAPLKKSVSFEPGYPDAAAIDPAAWRRIWRAMAAEKTHSHIEPLGDKYLRSALSEYIARTRGFHAAADDIIITAGTAQAIDLLSFVFRSAGMSRIGVEDPGYRKARHVFRHHGFSLVPLPVDKQGLMTGTLDFLLEKSPEALYVTPSHQYPLGGTLPVERRLSLLEWCRKNDAYIIEDDFDSEFRYDTLPIPALKSIDAGGRVAYIGTFSKIVSADLRLAYLIPPPDLKARIVQMKDEAHDFTPWPVQRAAYHLIRSGGLDRHVRRMRLLYAGRRKLVQDLLADLPRGFEIAGEQGGLHLVLLCPPKADMRGLIDFCARKDVEVVSLSDYYLDKPVLKGLVIGYGHLQEKGIRKGCEILRMACLFALGRTI